MLGSLTTSRGHYGVTNCSPSFQGHSVAIVEMTFPLQLGDPGMSFVRGSPGDYFPFVPVEGKGTMVGTLPSEELQMVKLYAHRIPGRLWS